MYSNLARSIYDSLLKKAAMFDREPVLKVEFAQWVVILKCLLTQDSFVYYYRKIKNGNQKELTGCQTLLGEFLQ